MTATDELRRLLDERGIEYEPIDSVHSPNRRTLWGKVERGKGIFGMDAKYETIEFKKGMRLTISDCSPEQAVEATLGRGECELIHTRDKPRSKALTLTCSECGWRTDRINDEWRYCPRCGKRVKA